MDASRRNFLRGQSTSVAPPLRPPWAKAEAEFLAECTRCDDCITHCPNGIIVRGDGGYPQIDFSRGECSFCADCVTACRPQALRRMTDEAPWALHAMIDTTCLAEQNIVCRSCADSCAALAIRFPPRLGAAALPEVSTALCTGCGACVAFCPTQAVAMQSIAASADRVGVAA